MIRKTYSLMMDLVGGAHSRVEALSLCRYSIFELLDDAAVTKLNFDALARMIRIET